MNLQLISFFLVIPIPCIGCPQVKACMEVYDNREMDCGAFSEPVSVSTMTGAPGRISDLLVECSKAAPHSPPSVISVHWEPPKVKALLALLLLL